MAPPKSGEQLAKAYYNAAAPLKLHTQKLMVKLTAPTTEKSDTAELDFVVVLDTSGSMRGKKLEQMKKAMDFVIKKLGDNKDNLAIVSFSSKAVKHHNAPVGLTSDSKMAATKLINGLKAEGNTNIEDGLRAGIEVLEARDKRSLLRAACIFLMSDGVQNVGDARKVVDQVRNVTVHTFGFGEKHDETLLWEIAHKSHAGLYHHVLEKEDFNDLSKSFAPSLGQYRSVSILDAQVKLTPKDKVTISRVDPGEYEIKKGDNGSFTIHFGDLAREEDRRIIVEIQLDVVRQNEKAKPVMTVEYSYTPPRNKKNRNPKPTNGSPLVIEMSRDGTADPDAMKEEVKLEVARRDQAEFLKKVKAFADKKDMDGANGELTTAKNALISLKSTKKEVMDALRTELYNVEYFLDSYDDYNKLGRAYLLACISSHARQRYAARGGDEEVPLFLTERMKKYQEQAKAIQKNPNIRI